MKEFLIVVVDPKDARNLTTLWEYDTAPEANKDLERLLKLNPTHNLVLLQVRREEGSG